MATFNQLDNLEKGEPFTSAENSSQASPTFSSGVSSENDMKKSDKANSYGTPKSRIWGWIPKSHPQETDSKPEVWPPREEPLPSIVYPVESNPRGYPSLASFCSSDENFMVFRRFITLHARLLLQKQDELRVLEDELKEKDIISDRSEEERKRNTLQCRQKDEKYHKSDGDESRTYLLEKIKIKLLEYDQILLSAQQVAMANRPPDRDYTSVENFMHNTQPLVEGDREFIYHKDDLMTLRPGRESAWLDSTVEKLLKLFPRQPVQYLFCSREDAMKSTDPNIRYFTKSRISFLVNCINIAFLLALFVLPIYTLYRFSLPNQADDGNTSNAICIGILLVATLLFSAAMSCFTKARRHEVLGAAAAYCALLVVFIGNIGLNKG